MRMVCEREMHAYPIRVTRAGLPLGPLGPCRTGLPRPGEPITEQHLERALEVMASIVVQHGECMAPLYEKIEKELEDMRRKRGPMDRARALLATRKSFREKSNV